MEQVFMIHRHYRDKKVVGVFVRFRARFQSVTLHAAPRKRESSFIQASKRNCLPIYEILFKIAVRIRQRIQTGVLG
jgi:hypothetical protein